MKSSPLSTLLLAAVVVLLLVCISSISQVQAQRDAVKQLSDAVILVEGNTLALDTKRDEVKTIVKLLDELELKLTTEQKNSEKEIDNAKKALATAELTIKQSENELAVIRYLRDTVLGVGPTLVSGSSRDFKVYSSAGLYIDIDTSKYNLKNPKYFTSISGKTWHWGIIGATSLFQVSNKGFRVYLRYSYDGPLPLSQLNQIDLKLDWIAVDTPDNADNSLGGISVGSLPMKDWRHYSNNGIVITGKTPMRENDQTIITSLSGTSHHWSTTGVSSVYRPATGGPEFSVYVRGMFWNIDLAQAAEYKYELNYLSITGHDSMLVRGSSTDWKDYEKAGIMMHVDTSAHKFKTTPVYITSLDGVSSHWESTGATSVYSPTPTGFTIYLRFTSGRLTVEFAKQYAWKLNWVAIRQ